MQGFFQLMGDFFIKEIKIESLTLNDVEQMDLHKLAYRFSVYANIATPVIKNELERQVVRNLIAKIGRVFLHQVLFPEIIKYNPNLAYSIKSLLKRNINEIARIENWNPHRIFDQLKIDELPGNPVIGYRLEQGQELKNTETDKTKTYFVCNFTEETARKLANVLIDGQILTAINPFIGLLFSHGCNIMPVKCSKENLPLLVHLIYTMYNTKVGKKRLLQMNFGKGYFKFAQENILDEAEAFSDEDFKDINFKIIHAKQKHTDLLKVQADVKKIMKHVFNK